MDSYRGHSFRSERDVLVSVLQKARSQAVSNMCFGAGCTDGKQHGVHIESNQYTIFQGATWAARDPAVDEVTAIQSKTITAVGFTDVVFAELSGTAAFTPAGATSTTLTDTAGKDTSIISITPEGRICWDDPSC